MAVPSVKTSGAVTGEASRLRRWAWFWGHPLMTGLLLWAAFPPLRLTGTIFIAWLPLLSLIQGDLDSTQGLRPKGLWRRVWLAGFIFAAALLYWIAALSNEQVTIPGLMFPSILLIATYYGLFFLLLGGLIRWVARSSHLPLGLLFPIFWTLVEWIRTLGPLGFPWGSPGYAFARVPTAVQFIAWTGFWGLNLWIGLVTGLLHEALRWAARRGPFHPRSLALFGGALVVLLLPVIHGKIRLHGSPPREAALGGPGGVTVGIVQPNVIREIKWRPGGAEASWEKLRAGSEKAMRLGAQILIWPETALPLRLLHHEPYLHRVQRLVTRGDVALVAGTLHSEGAPGTPDFRPFNSAFIMSPEGVTEPLYHKQKLVPFSERMPLQKILPFLTQIDFGQSDFVAGRETIIFRWGSLRMAPLICFESIFPDLSQRFARSGANVLVNITNDFWFGDTPGPVQHAEMAILRTVETGLPLIRCANTGLSFFVDRYGRIVQFLGTFREGVLVAEVGPGELSFAARHGPWLLWILSALGVGTLGTGLFWRRRVPHE